MRAGCDSAGCEAACASGSASAAAASAAPCVSVCAVQASVPVRGAHHAKREAAA
jgi:hypothetical protein